MHFYSGSSAHILFVVNHPCSLTLSLLKENSYSLSHQSSLTVSSKATTLSGTMTFLVVIFLLLNTFSRKAAITLSGVDTPELIPIFSCPNFAESSLWFPSVLGKILPDNFHLLSVNLGSVVYPKWMDSCIILCEKPSNKMPCTTTAFLVQLDVAVTPFWSTGNYKTLVRGPVYFHGCWSIAVRVFLYHPQIPYRLNSICPDPFDSRLHSVFSRSLIHSILSFLGHITEILQ